MIVNVRVNHSPTHYRINYLLFGVNGTRDQSKVEILSGNAYSLNKIASQIKYKVKSYDFLISFAESKQELEKKLKKYNLTIEDLNNEINELLYAGYSQEEIAYLDVGHADTEHYHIHKTLLNKNLLTNTSIYLPKTKSEIEYYRLIEEYISKKYGLDFNIRLRGKGRAGLEKVKYIMEQEGRLKNKDRDKVKDLITELISNEILKGNIETREDIAKYLSEKGFEINRFGKSYITIKYKDTKIRLKGGVYDDERFERIKREIRAGTQSTRADISRELAELERKLNEYKQRRIELIEKRYKTARERATARVEEYQKSEKIKQHIHNNITDINIDTSTISKPQATATDKRDKTKSRHNSKQSKDNSRLSKFSSITYKKNKLIQDFKQKRKEELEAIKNIDPELIISYLNIKVASKGKDYYLCHAPYRPDKNPSLTIFYSNGWKWKDKATGETGSWIDLVMKTENLSYVDAVKILRESFLGTEIVPDTDKHNEYDNRYEIIEIKEHNIKRNVIKDFLKKIRKVNDIPDFVREIEYKIKDKKTGEIKSYFGYGTKDEAGNYHIRFALKNPKVKERVLSLKKEKSSHTHIKKDKNIVAVVEGIHDAIALLNMINNRKIDIYKNLSIIILNSVENIFKSLKDIEKYNTIIIATDNDNAGDMAKNRILHHIKSLKDKDKNKEVYQLMFDSKDIDDAYKQNKKVTIKHIFSSSANINIEADNETIKIDMSNRRNRRYYRNR